jgi:hypothetical protein
MKSLSLPAFAVLAVAMATALASGCTAYHQVAVSPQDMLPADASTQVRVTDRHGDRTRLVSVYIEHDSLIGRDFVLHDPRKAIAISDIGAFEIGEANIAGTLTLILAITYGVLAIIVQALRHGAD